MVDIVLTIKDSKVDEFREGFLKQNPVPLDDETGEPTMGDLDWFKESIRLWALRIYKQGKMKLLQDTYDPDPDLFD